MGKKKKDHNVFDRTNKVKVKMGKNFNSVKNLKSFRRTPK